MPKIVDPELGEEESTKCIKVIKSRMRSDNASSSAIASVNQLRRASLTYEFDRSEVANLLAKEGKKGKIGIFWVSKLKRAYMYKKGTQGLLDMAINKALSLKLQKRLEAEKVDFLVGKYYLNVFSQAFKDEGFDVKVFKENLYSPSGDLFETKAKEFDLDYMFVLAIGRFGIERSYAEFIPVGEPRGYSYGKVMFGDIKENNLLVQFNSYARKMNKGLWDDPPEYANLMTTLEESFESLIDYVFFKIFQRAP